MRGFLIRAVVVGIGLWLASQIVPGLHFVSTESLIAAALLLGIVNALVRPILVILTFPITILTLGLFLLGINGLMIDDRAGVCTKNFIRIDWLMESPNVSGRCWRCYPLSWPF